MTHKGKFLALTEAGTTTPDGTMTGVDYLADLGVTHIQMLPVYDFGSVDEFNPFGSYNWGYDPVQYNVPEGSYSTDISDPYSRILELKQAIAYLHGRGMRVIMDVVYNHMHDMGASAFEKIVPGYYFRTDAEGNLSNGSFCGNDLDSTRPMFRNFLMESTRMWIEDYGFDGFRFDLMGILDIDTMNAIAEQTLAIDPNAMIYGEGWNMPTFLEDDRKATMMNHAKMPNIAHFSDIFRDKIKGATMTDRVHEVGYGTGDVERSLDAMHLLLGTVMHVNNEGNYIEPYFSEPSQTVNYVECHDNHTLWDKLSISLKDEPDEIRVKRHKFITGLVILSQGIPFIHGGQEFLRSKEGEHNTYRSSDEINMFRWLKKDEHQEVVDYVKALIELRRTYQEFSLDTTEDIRNKTSVEALENYVISYRLANVEEDCGYEELLVLINPNMVETEVEMEQEYTEIFDADGWVDKRQQKKEAHIEPLSIHCYLR